MALIANQSYEVALLDTLSQHPENPNVGDVEAIQESIEANDFYGALVVQKSTGYILAGNHRFLAAKAAGMAELPAVVVDVDDTQARRILLVDNQAARLGVWDEARLAAVLSDLAVAPGELAGTGFEQADLDDLMALVEETDDADRPATTGSNEESDSDQPGPGGSPKEEADDGEQTTNTFVGGSYRDLQQRYLDKAAKALVLEYPLDAYNLVTGRLAELRRARGVESNAELVAGLVADAVEALP